MYYYGMSNGSNKFNEMPMHSREENVNNMKGETKSSS